MLAGKLWTCGHKLYSQENMHILTSDRKYMGGFPGNPVVGDFTFQCRGVGSVPGQGAKIPGALQPKNIKQKHGLPWWSSG